MTYRNIISIFASEDQAKAAVHALEEEGFSAGDISIVEQQALGASNETPGREPGFWNRLFGGELHEHEAAVFQRSVEDGGYVLTARVPLADFDRATGVLNKFNPVHVREASQ